MCLKVVGIGPVNSVVVQNRAPRRPSRITVDDGTAEQIVGQIKYTSVPPVYLMADGTAP